MYWRSLAALVLVACGRVGFEPRGGDGALDDGARDDGARGDGIPGDGPLGDGVLGDGAIGDAVALTCPATIPFACGQCDDAAVGQCTYTEGCCVCNAGYFYCDQNPVECPALAPAPFSPCVMGGAICRYYCQGVAEFVCFDGSWNPQQPLCG